MIIIPQTSGKIKRFANNFHYCPPNIRQIITWIIIKYPSIKSRKVSQKSIDK
ncbi:hypothetical protein CBFG_02832 [Clostridiales bacterium 1_7_47FAA]|nr:hypothetical protein CBFG_02832 [Clostridiales bacterium 1_7_47FAA]